MSWPRPTNASRAQEIQWQTSFLVPRQYFFYYFTVEEEGGKAGALTVPKEPAANLTSRGHGSCGLFLVLMEPRNGRSQREIIQITLQMNKAESPSRGLGSLGLYHSGTNTTHLCDTSRSQHLCEPILTVK